jgi:membrane dipeptidase
VLSPGAIADLHSDLLQELALARARPNPFAERWLGNLRAGGVELQVCALFVETQDDPGIALREALGQLAAAHRAARENPADAVLVRTREDLDAGDRIRLVLALEGAALLAPDPDLVDVLWELGVRLVGLTWNRRNAFADGAAERPAGGLSRRGEELVDRLVARGAVLDLAHASERSFRDVLERSGDAPVLVSHAACRALNDHPRNLDDAQLRALAARDGVLGLMLLPVAIGYDAPTLERVTDHVAHAIDVMGPAHVALGSDFIRQVWLARGGTTPSAALAPAGASIGDAIEGLAGPEGYPRLVAALRDRGIDGALLEGVLAGNAVRLLARSLPDG